MRIIVRGKKSLYVIIKDVQKDKSLRQKDQITQDSPNQQISNWILVGKVKKPIRNELNSNKLSLRIAEKALGYGFSGLD